MPPGADKSPVNQTGMLGPRISSPAHDEDVPLAFWSIVGSVLLTVDKISLVWMLIYTLPNALKLRNLKVMVQ